MSDNKEYTPPNTYWKAHSGNPQKQSNFGRYKTSVARKTVFDKVETALITADTAELAKEIALTIEARDREKAAYNSYAKHAKDPIAAAEGDLLGQALDAIAIMLECPSSSQAIIDASEILAQRKV